MRVLLVVVAMVALVACGGDGGGECELEDAQAIESMILDGAVSHALVAMRAAPGATGVETSALLDQLDDASDALAGEDWPGCRGAEDVREAYADWITIASDALTAQSLGNTDQATRLFDDAQVAYADANRALTRLASN